jgi:N-methylhydantoinase A
VRIVAYVLGVDVGGTFTDLALFDRSQGTLTLAKVPSTPEDQSLGVEEGIRQLMRQNGVQPAEIDFLIHGTTVATNAVLEGKGERAALLVTEGFADVLDIIRQDRPRLYDWRVMRPTPLIPRSLRWEVPERILYTGEILRSLDEDRVRQIIAEIRERGINSIAVCFLHAYANPAHERRTAELIAELHPSARISLSGEILPEIKEYERMSTTVMNAVVTPIVYRYLQRLSERTQQIGLLSELHVMQSNGGIMTARTAAQKSAQSILSGLAGGVLGGVWVARQANYSNAITIDMGGTSFDISLAYQGKILFSRETEIGGHALSFPMIDVHTLGAGGGSIAWIDSGGALQVGPQSAGANPGPACYGKGGLEPTVTDANVVLGRLNPAYLLGGAMAIQPELAREAIAQRIAEPLGLTVEQAAYGIIRVINANMLKGIRVVSVERGYDPREFTMVAFGGGGPLHAADLADELGVAQVLVPIAPGVTSAMGLLVADFRHDYTRTYLQATDSLSLAEWNELFAGLEAEATAQLLDEHVTPEDIVLERSVEMRYRGQGYSLEVPVPDGSLDAKALARVNEAFHHVHQARYGYSRRDQVTEFVNLHLIGIGRLRKPQPAESTAGSRDPVAAQVGTRRVYFDGDWLETPVFYRQKLRHGHYLNGSAVIEQLDSTALVPPGWTAFVDAQGNLVLSADLQRRRPA